MTDGYDVIGDVHGHADQLERLLDELGYRTTGGVHRHPERRAVFLGDLVDRGPDQLRVLDVVRSMVDAGTARLVMGNHELNAISWTVPDGRGGWSRPHSEKNRRQHRAFLDQVGEGSATHRDWIEWFRTVPLWLDLAGVRVVHACWDPVSMARLGGPTLTDEMITAPTGSPLYDALEIVLKGPEIPLDGRCYRDKDGHERREARFRWWDPSATTVASGAELPGGITDCDGGPFAPLPHDPLPPDLPAVPDGTPVLYGHYWRRGTPAVDGPRTACLDWSVANGGPLVAYRWSGEHELTDDHLVAVT